MYFSKEIAADSVVNETTQEVTSFFDRLINYINIEEQISSIISMTIKILIVVLLFYIAKRIGDKIINYLFDKQRKRGRVPAKRHKTLNRLTLNAFTGLIYFLMAFTILEIIGIPIGSLLAGAGVVGLAISLGAQGFVSDIVNGFMIMLEKQIDIGEVVVISGIEGTVIDTNLKTTKIKAFDGAIHYIPNREILVIENRSRSNMRAQIQVRLYPGTDLETVRKIIDSVNQEYVPVNSNIKEDPSEILFVPAGNGQFAVEVNLFTTPGTEYNVQMEFYERYLSALDEHGIKLPNNSLELPLI